MAKILIIEDDPYVQKMYQRLFEHEDFKVEKITTGEDGLKAAKSSKPDLILLDILLPGISGLEVLKQLKADSETKNIPVLIITNVGEEAAIEEANRLGADSYMIKADFTPEQILQQVRKTLTAKTG